MVKDIGHGMVGGPLTLGRFGVGKYCPPDRSDEILPTMAAAAMPTEPELAAHKTADAEAEEAAEAVAKAVAQLETVNRAQELDLD
jgi:hypothetical protein